MDLIYLDNNATTMPAPDVAEAMLPYLKEIWANPSSVHRFGQQARRAVDVARSQVAALIGCGESQLFFTSGGTESINTALRGLLAARSPRRRIVTSSVEHSATRQLCDALRRDGAQIIEIPVNHLGHLDLSELESALTDDTALVSIMWANNETGILFPVERIAHLCRDRRIPFHCDGTQAVGKIPVSVTECPMDAMSFAAHKFHGPKGIGGLYVRPGLRLRPLLIGGPQERDRRGGTENVPGIVGMGKAADLALASLGQMARVGTQRDHLERGIIGTIPESSVNGDPAMRIPNTTNIGFTALEADAILLLLSEQGICASAGAACSSGSLEPSHVLKAMGIDPRTAHGAVRFSLSRFTTDAEIERTLIALPPIIRRLRDVLPTG